MKDYGDEQQYFMSRARDGPKEQQFVAEYKYPSRFVDHAVQQNDSGVSVRI